MTDASGGPCHLCRGELEPLPGFERRWRVTSDSRPWPVGGGLAMCVACGTLQKPVTPTWRDEVERIYRSYAIYDQGGGVEQLAFDDAGAAPRSSRLADAVLPFLPSGGFDALDIGCGNGAFLRALSARSPTARLVGTEYDDRNRASVTAIPGVVEFYQGAIDEREDGFDLVSIIHVLEHIENPASFLRRVAGRVKPGGRLLIEVPNRETNLFDVLIADHCTHFDSEGLITLCQEAGFQPLMTSTTVVAKEVTLLLTFDACGPQRPRPPSRAKISAALSGMAQKLRSLERMVEQAQALMAGSTAFGIFGSSISATWLDSELERHAQFFVDEDGARIGRRWLDRPILAPDQVPPGATVFVPLVPSVAGRVIERLGRGGGYHASPDDGVDP